MNTTRKNIDHMTAEDALSVLMTAYIDYWTVAEDMGHGYWRFLPYDEPNMTVHLRQTIVNAMRLVDERGHTMMRTDLIEQFDKGLRDDWAYGCPFDAELADVIVQIGLFSEIVFG